MDQIGKYRVEGVLGQGGMGIVYKAVDPHIGRTVAIKTIKRSILGAEPEKHLERFLREAQAAGRLQHPNVVMIYDYGEHDGSPVIVMEYVEGRELRQYLDSGLRFGSEEAIEVIQQLLHGLEHAHQRHVIHRDLKPANVILLEDRFVKVADFGVAKINTSGSSITQQNLVVGTPSYMSPEQFLGQPVDARSDLFSVGIILFELLTGTQPFVGDNVTQIMYQIVNAQPPAVSAVNPSLVDAPFDRVVARVLQKNPADRFQSAREFIEALRSPTAVKPVVATSFTNTFTETLEKHLTKHVGPVARILIRRAVKECKNEADVVASLSRQIPDAKERMNFLEICTPAAAGFESPRTSQSETSVITLDAKILEEAEARLAKFIGPLARVIVKREAKTATDKDSLYQQLSRHIDAPKDRENFLRNRPK